jgi:hypothetical protein
MFYAKFPIEGVKKIYEHSIANPVFTPTFSQLYEAEYRKDGKDFEETEGHSWPKADEVDNEKIPQQFFLVKDSGAYLMAATVERLPGEEDAEKGRSGYNFVVYCEGCNPSVDDDYWERQQAAFSGDDFSEGLPLEWLKMAIDNAEAVGIDMMIIKVTKNGLELMKGKRA